MPKDQREPQSYGSNADWVTGRTGQQVNEPESEPAPERDFAGQGGKVSDVQLADTAEPRGTPHGEHEPVSKVTASEGGSKLGGYFKKRDYE